MKRIPAILLTALLASPAALAQDAPGPPPPPPGQGQGERADRPDREPGPRSDRPDREDRGDRGQRPDRDRDGRDDRGGGDWQLPADQLDDAIDLIERMNPRLAHSLRETQAQSPQRAIQRLAEEAPRTYELMRMRAQEPERFALHMRSMQVMRETWPLMRELRQAQRDQDQPTVDRLAGEIRTAMETLYDIRLALRELEIDELRQQLADLEAQHARDREQRDEHIDHKVNDILNDHNGRRRGDRSGDRPDDDRPDGPPRGDRSRGGPGPRD